MPPKLMPSLQNPFEENRWNPPEDNGELGNPARCVGSISPPTLSFTEEPPKSPKKFNNMSMKL